MAGPWDAPYAFRDRYAGPEDPPPPDFHEVPCLRLAEDYDPDLLLGISQAYAGQVSLLDACLGALAGFLGGSPSWQDSLLVLASARGFPLGEHGQVGALDDALYGELVHVPWMIRFPDGSGTADRSSALVESADLGATLLQSCGVGGKPFWPLGKSLVRLVREDVTSLRDRLCLVGDDHQWGIRTPAWYLRMAERPELYVKPDDRFEVNDVTDRCPDVAEGLVAAFHQYEVLLGSNQLDAIPPLEGVLLEGMP
jgi:arylsulfatase A-like enzyme